MDFMKNAVHHLMRNREDSKMLRQSGFMDIKKNALYCLIRERAGSEMLRRAEMINAYNTVFDCIDEGEPEMATAITEKFRKEYPLSDAEIKMSLIRLEEIVMINPHDLTYLPWVYVHMLQALTWHDFFAAKLLNDKLEASVAAGWRIPLPEGVSNADSFSYVYEEWLKHNEERLEVIYVS